MADNNSSQDKWLAVSIWLGLLVGVGFTSNALMGVFGGIIQTVFQLVQGEMKALFMRAVESKPQLSAFTLMMPTFSTHLR